MQVMTFLIENEEAALVVPARFLGQIHPHFREIQQVLASPSPTKPATSRCSPAAPPSPATTLALSTVGGRASLQTLLDEPDYATASFLLSVMGEGTFVSLLSFLERHAPDPLTRRIAHLTRNDEARHVAFSLGPPRTPRPTRTRAPQPARPSRRATPPRAAAARAGLNEDVFDALVLLAAGDTTPTAIARRLAARPRPPARHGRGPPSPPRPPRLHPRRSRGAVVAPHPQLHVTNLACRQSRTSCRAVSTTCIFPAGAWGVRVIQRGVVGERLWSGDRITSRVALHSRNVDRQQGES